MEVRKLHPINFEGVSLPDGIYWLELLTYIMPNVSEASRDWALDLHYSLGKERSATSEQIFECISELENILNQNEAFVEADLDRRMPNIPAHQIIKDWRIGMALMKAIAKNRNICRWKIAATEEEMENAGELLLAFLDRFAVEHDLDGVELYEFEQLKKKIAASSPENRHEMLNAALESLNNRNQ